MWKTIEFDAAPGDDLHVSIVNRAAPGMLALVALFGAGPMYVTMEVVKGAAAAALAGSAVGAGANSPQQSAAQARADAADPSF